MYHDFYILLIGNSKDHSVKRIIFVLLINQTLFSQQLITICHVLVIAVITALIRDLENSFVITDHVKIYSLENRSYFALKGTLMQI